MQSKAWKAEEPFTISDARKLLCARYDEISYEQAKEDVLPFIRDPASLALWNADFFKQITEGLK